MKKNLLIFLFFCVSSFIMFPREIETKRIYCTRLVSFNRIYDIYYTFEPCGYYKYQKTIGNQTCYVTYETADFYDKCCFDENLYLIKQNVPMNIYTNSCGEVMRFRPKFGPVIEKDRKHKNYPHGYGQNYGGHFINK